MTSLVQSSIFDFKPRERPAQWLTLMGGERRRLCRTDAEAFVRELGTIPTGQTWPRCMEIDHKSSYNRWCGWASARMWGHGGIGEQVLVDHHGRVEWTIDPYPYERYWKDGKQVRENEHGKIVAAEIEGDRLRLTVEGMGDWLAEIYPDEEVRRYDRHPYDPTRDMEHFAIECYRQGLPGSMFAWRAHYVYATDALRPFYRTMDEDEAKKTDLMGPIAGSWAPNPDYDEILACAEALGLTMKLRHGPPALANLAMYPVEQTCQNCIHRGGSNKEDGCWKKRGQSSCRGWLWDRKTPAKPYRKGKKLARTPCGCDEEEECGC